MALVVIKPVVILLFHPQYICVFCSCVHLHNQQHVLVMCAVAFYMMENYPLDVGAEFIAGIIQVNSMFMLLCVDKPPPVMFPLLCSWPPCFPGVWNYGLSQWRLHSFCDLSLCAAWPWTPAAVRAVVSSRRWSTSQTKCGQSEYAFTTPSHGCPRTHAHLHVHR